MACMYIPGWFATSRQHISVAGRRPKRGASIQSANLSVSWSHDGDAAKSFDEQIKDLLEVFVTKQVSLRQHSLQEISGSLCHALLDHIPFVENCQLKAAAQAQEGNSRLRSQLRNVHDQLIRANEHIADQECSRAQADDAHVAQRRAIQAAHHDALAKLESEEGQHQVSLEKLQCVLRKLHSEKQQHLGTLVKLRSEKEARTGISIELQSELEAHTAIAAKLQSEKEARTAISNELQSGTYRYLQPALLQSAQEAHTAISADLRSEQEKYEGARAKLESSRQERAAISAQLQTEQEAHQQHDKSHNARSKQIRQLKQELQDTLAQLETNKAEYSTKIACLLREKEALIAETIDEKSALRGFAARVNTRDRLIEDDDGRKEAWAIINLRQDQQEVLMRASSITLANLRARCSRLSDRLDIIAPMSLRVVDPKDRVSFPSLLANAAIAREMLRMVRSKDEKNTTEHGTSKRLALS
ncbi:hypothetical protein EJ03DRAFT_379896 [Teratosphaeria nubilosa]|uniref:Uncharacterized protein n=1 Tax=Teratosphaeria nubilosa TaxID=161662 RepID=A0A6G1LN48_9PEZI|nr:hypothetical protein EJ03DRAFT_379896 [Teratosphaeria nubilosa]